MSYRRGGDQGRQSFHSRSPRRQLNSELEEHSNKIKELLRHDLNLLEEENAILKAKCKKLTDLEDKTQTLLRQNSGLLAENEKISKLLHQKKSQYEILKNKYEANMAHRQGATAEFEFERKKLVNEIQILEAELREAEASKNNQINEINSQYQLQIQSIKRQNSSSQQVYQQEIRKYREMLEKKDYENSENLNKLKRLSSESEYEIIRLRQEKQKLRNQLVYLENERKKDLQSLKSKLQVNYLEEIDTLKRNHYSNLDGIETENIRLKQYLEARGRQVEDLNTKINKQKIHFEETIALLRKQNENVRLKMLEGQRYSEHEIDNLKLKLTEMHEAEIEQLKINHQKYNECLQNEIVKLQGYLRNKNEEIEQLIKQKTTVRQMFQAQTGRLKEQNEALQFRIRDLENQAKQIQGKFEEKLKEKDEHIQYLDDLNKDQREANDKQQNSLRQLIQLQKNDLDQERIANREKEQALKESVAQYKTENGTLKDELRKQRADKERQLEDLRNDMQGNIIQLQTKVETLTSQANIAGRENQSHRRAIQIKDKEIRSLQERVRGSDERQKKYEKEIEDLRMKLIKKDQKTNEMLADQKKRLEESFSYTLDNLKHDNEGALRLQQNKIADAREKLRLKQKQLDDLLKAYKKMREEVEVLTQQQANKKEMTLKYPGATADLIATKNLFDVYLKTRVLDLCGDAADKQNR